MVRQRFDEVFENECVEISEEQHPDHISFLVTLSSYRNSIAHLFVDLLEKVGTSSITYEYNGQMFEWDVELISEERF
jgi:hypothetical protein